MKKEKKVYEPKDFANYPYEVFPKEVKEALDNVVTREKMKPFVYHMALAFFGYAYSKNYKAEHKSGWVERSNLMAIGLAGSGSGKSHIYNAFKKTIDRVFKLVEETHERKCKVIKNLNRDVKQVQREYKSQLNDANKVNDANKEPKPNTKPMVWLQASINNNVPYEKCSVTGEYIFETKPILGDGRIHI